MKEDLDKNKSCKLFEKKFKKSLQNSKKVIML